MTDSCKVAWGLLPSDINQLVYKREWQNKIQLKSRLLGTKPFPIKIGLKPPNGRDIIQDLNHFQDFINKWKKFTPQSSIIWEERNYRSVSTQSVPKFFILDSVQKLLEFLGREALEQSTKWSHNMAPFLDINKDLYPILIKYLEIVESMTKHEAILASQILVQLSLGMGDGKYLRSLPLVGVDTKFLETHFNLIADLLDSLTDGDISKKGGLLDWLDCIENPKGWLTIRPLCDKVKKRLGNLPIFQLPTHVLCSDELPAKNIIVVENMESGLSLPEFEDTITVFGGGKNVSWMNADWLYKKRVAYWGDIDTWGLSFLSDVRQLVPHVSALMMDSDTLHKYTNRAVLEPKSFTTLPEYLTESEKKLFNELKSEEDNAVRLEQERLSPDYIYKQLERWINNK